MRGSELRIYADTRDMAEVLSAIDEAGTFRYTEALSKANNPALSFEGACSLLGFLRTTHPQASSVFLILDQTAVLNLREIVLRDGSGTKVSADQIGNPDAVLIKLGGQLDEQRTLIATSVNTTGETHRAKEVFKLLKMRALPNAKYFGGFYVLPGALEKFNAGWRLTPDPGYSPVLDLKNE